MCDIYTGYASSLGLDFLKALRLPEKIIEYREDINSIDVPFQPFYVHSRPLGNVVYLMTTLWTQSSVVRSMEQTILQTLAERAKGKS